MSLLFTRDAAGVPGIVAGSITEAYQGIGFLHGRYRPIQVALLHTAAQGQLSKRFLPLAALKRLDAVVWDWDIAAQGHRAVKDLSFEVHAWAQAYLQGLDAGFQTLKPGMRRWVVERGCTPSPQSILSGMLLSGFLGLAESQNRMELALAHLLAAKACPNMVAALWPNQSIEEVTKVSQMLSCQSQNNKVVLPSWDGLEGGVKMQGYAPPLAGLGGSNAWAVAGCKSQSGKPILAADPHLQVDVLPSVFFEVRIRLPDTYWLGATVPGLPALALGRTHKVAWGGTFSCADNVDGFIEDVDDGEIVRLAGTEKLQRMDKRFAWSKRSRFQSLRGWSGVAPPAGKGKWWVQQWLGGQKPAEALAAYLNVPLCTDVAELQHTLGKAHSLGLEYVLADTHGAIAKMRAGAVPKREAGWDGLLPYLGSEGGWECDWENLQKDKAWSLASVLDAKAQLLGCLPWYVVSANDARGDLDRRETANLAQPNYRSDRIKAILAKRSDWNAALMGKVQTDVFSIQAERLAPVFARWRQADSWSDWDYRYGGDGIDGYRFECLHKAGMQALAPWLGGSRWLWLLAHTEAPVWFLAGFDQWLETWIFQAARHWSKPACAVYRAIVGYSFKDECQAEAPEDFVFQHILAQGVPRWHRKQKRRTLYGSRATVCQGHRTQGAQGQAVIAPAYRMICDLGEDALQSTLCGGIDGNPASDGYGIWIDEWSEGRLHTLKPPTVDEERLVF